MKSKSASNEITDHAVRRRFSPERLDALQSVFNSRIIHYEGLLSLAMLTALAAFSFLFASREPFFVDEYLSLQTALAGTPQAVWNVLKTAPLAVDPPLYHFLNVYSLRLFGPTEFAARIPSSISYTVMSFLLYRFTRRYTDLFTGLIVLAFCLQCGTFAFSYQARPYTLVLAASVLALTCWANVAERRSQRTLSLLGLFGGSAIAIGSHWFGFLVLIPIGAAELYRSVEERKVDAGVWGTLIAAAGSGLAYVPLLGAAAKYKALPWKGVSLSDVSESYRVILHPCLFPLVLLLVTLAVARFLTGPLPRHQKAVALATPVFFCIIAFALIPFVGFLVGKLVTHAFQSRYALSSTIGVLTITGFAIRDSVRRYVPLLALTFVIVAGYALFSHYRELSSMRRDSETANFADGTVLALNSELPVLPSDDDLFLRLEAHAPAAIRHRCFFPIDPISISLLHQNTNFLMTEALRKWTNLPIVDLSTFLDLHPRFYFLERPGARGWLLQWALQQGAEAKLQGNYAGNIVYLVQMAR